MFLTKTLKIVFFLVKLKCLLDKHSYTCFACFVPGRGAMFVLFDSSLCNVLIFSSVVFVLFSLFIFVNSFLFSILLHTKSNTNSNLMNSIKTRKVDK